MFLLQMLVAFIVVVGILVTVHEFGHYWVAQRLGVKILRFSIGFGQALWVHHHGKDNTEFVIATIPLGGYVKMLDEREGEVASTEVSRAFNRQSLAVRMAIVVAGPLFNLLFAVIVYMFMYMWGVTGLKPLVGEVVPHSLADQAGFKKGYEIIAVGEVHTVRWESVVQATLEHLLDDKKEVKYSVSSEQGYTYQLALSLQELVLEDITEGKFFKKLGLYPLRPSPPAIIGKVMPNSAAQRVGLHPGDKIISLDGQEIQDWNMWADYVAKHPNQEISALIERNHQKINMTFKPDNQEGHGRMGVYGPQEYSVPEHYISVERYGIGGAFQEGLKLTWETSLLMLRVMFKMITLEISLQNIGGPLSIAEYAGKSAQSGLVTFLFFLGSVSVSLGVINLLPIPLLDGGHLLFYLLELIKGHPLAESTEYFLQKIGLALLLSLMGVAIFNDIGRVVSTYFSS